MAPSPPPVNPSASIAPNYNLRPRPADPVPLPKAIVPGRKSLHRDPIHDASVRDVMANEAAKKFFSSPYFAVAGASQDKAKFGYKSELPFLLHLLPSAITRHIKVPMQAS